VKRLNEIYKRRFFMKVEELEVRINALENQVRTLQTLLDIEEIKKLQRAYGYYLQHWLGREIVDLFSDGPDVALEFPSAEGTYVGKESVKRYYENRFKGGPAFIHQLMQLSPIIDIDPDGKTARGRWYGFGAVATQGNNVELSSYMNGTYENEYVKEGGKWKIKRLSWAGNYSPIPPEDWVMPAELIASIPKPDIPPTGSRPPYPSGYIFPYHFKHPVTGKKTSEEKLNASLNIRKGK
jgi:hypothetical protein